MPTQEPAQHNEQGESQRSAQPQAADAKLDEGRPAPEAALQQLHGGASQRRPADLLQLQRAGGNRALGKLLKETRQHGAKLSGDHTDRTGQQTEPGTGEAARPSVQRLTVEAQATGGPPLLARGAPLKDQSALPAAATREVVQMWRRFSTPALPTGTYADWLLDVHYTYLSDNRGNHNQLHITFTDNEEPELEKGRKKNAWLWFKTSDGSWSWAGKDDPQIEDADLEWYKRAALMWAKDTEDQYLATLKGNHGQVNEFTDHAATAKEEQDAIDEEEAAD